MSVLPQVPAEDRNAFLQEAEEQLQALDELFLRLEEEANSAPLLEEIFRLVHTLKGSAGLLGYRPMAEVAHALEGRLDRLRRRDGRVPTPEVDLLLRGLDALRSLKRALEEGQEPALEVEGLVEALTREPEGGLSPEPAPTPLEAGPGVYRVQVHIGGDPLWASLRAYQALTLLREVGEVVASSPSPEEIEAGAGGPLFTFQVATREPIQAVVQALRSIPEVERVEVSPGGGGAPRVLSPEAFLQRVEEEVSRSRRTGAPFAVGVFRFAGARERDRALEALPRLVRAYDGLAPWESASVALLFPEADRAEAESAVRRLAQALPEGASPVRAGTASYPQDGEEGKALLRTALERASQGGIPAPPREQAPGQPLRTVRIDVARLDNLMDLVGELVIDHLRILQIGRALEGRYPGDEAVQTLGRVAAHLVKVVSDLHEEVMQARMVPIGTIFGGLTRLVRDLAHQMGKEVELTIEGAETQIDRRVAEAVREPLVHLLRNAVDHGIEAPAERQARGKPARGRVRLSAYQEQGHIVVDVEDDGRGIDPQRLREAAVRKGLLSPEGASRLSDAEALDLIFRPGFSTAQQVTEVSGRGVGMDVVRTKVEAVNGFVRVHTRPGRGTTFRLTLPLTLATIRGLPVEVGREIYILPLMYVVEVVRVEAVEVGSALGRRVLRLRGRTYPLLRLGEVLDPLRNGGKPGERFVVVIRSGDREVGLAVDRVQEPQEVVVKALGRYIRGVRGVVGASILPSGRVALILDAPSLLYTLNPGG